MKIQGDLSLTRQKIGLVTSRFNEEVTDKLEAGALARLKELGVPEDQIVQISIPGAFEIPLVVKSLLESGCDGVVALGAVIRGETAHFDYVCRGVERGCAQLQLEYEKPVGFGLLTTENREQALARAGGAKGNKGAEAVDVTLEMMSLLRKVKEIK